MKCWEVRDNSTVTYYDTRSNIFICSSKCSCLDKSQEKGEDFTELRGR